MEIYIVFFGSLSGCAIASLQGTLVNCTIIESANLVYQEEHEFVKIIKRHSSPSERQP